MEKKSYITPEVEILYFCVEQGFSVSTPNYNPESNTGVEQLGYDNDVL